MSQPNGGNQQGAGQGDQQQQGQQPPQGQQPQTQTQPGGVLDQMAGQSGAVVTPPAQQQIPQPGHGQSTDPVLQAIQGLEQRMTAEIDRRINGVAQTLRREIPGGGQQQGNGGQGQPQQQWGGGGNGGQQPPQQGQPQQQEQQRPVFTSADLQEARSTYRDFIGDEVQFLGAAERDLAATIAIGLIQTGLIDGQRPDQLGRDVAAKVAEQVKAARGLYETKTIEGLRVQGLLKDGVQPQQQGQPLPGGQNGPGAQSGFAAGAAKAAALFPGRQPAGQQQ